MNTQLQKLFDIYKISDKDCYEINQIFCIVDDEKKHHILANFELLAKKIQKIEDEIILEQEILLDNILPDLQKLLK